MTGDGGLVHWDEVEPERGDDGHIGGAWRFLGRAAGSSKILEGDGTLELVPSPRSRDRGNEEQQHPVRAGHVVARPPGTQIAHAFRGGDNGMKVLMYGWRDTNDITYYPRSNKIGFRGVGLMTRLEPLGYWDGEPEQPD